MTTQIAHDSLARGACCALQHAVHTLEDSAALYGSQRYSSSFHLAAMAREELGRCVLLVERRHSLPDGQTVDAEKLAKDLQSHSKKLRKGQLVVPVPMSPETLLAWTAAIEQNDAQTVARMSAEVFARGQIDHLRDQQAKQLHQRRLKAQYVDINVHDGTWSRPSEVMPSDARMLINTVMCEIANVLIASQSTEWIRASFAASDEDTPEMGPFTHRVLAHLAKGDTQQGDEADVRRPPIIATTLDGHEMSDGKKRSPEELERRQRWFENHVRELGANSVVRRAEPGVRFACPCCRQLTLDERGGYEICPVCFWEDDGQDDQESARVRGGSNGPLSLDEARRNYVAYGACDEKSRQHVRPPLPDERATPV